MNFSHWQMCRRWYDLQLVRFFQTDKLYIDDWWTIEPYSRALVKMVMNCNFVILSTILLWVSVRRAAVAEFVAVESVGFIPQVNIGPSNILPKIQSHRTIWLHFVSISNRMEAISLASARVRWEHQRNLSSERNMLSRPYRISISKHFARCSINAMRKTHAWRLFVFSIIFFIFVLRICKSQLHSIKLH